MRYVSTRGEAPPVSFAEAFAAGLAPDGGLYVPEELPQIVPELLAAESLSYADLAFRFLSVFDTTHDAATLRDIVDRSYSNFDDDTNQAPLVSLSENLSVLELFHGPTLAFKDFGLQLVGNLFEDQIVQNRPHHQRPRCDLRRHRFRRHPRACGQSWRQRFHHVSGWPHLAIAGATDDLHRRV